MSACRSCGAPVVWARMMPSGKAVPLDPEPVVGGNIVLGAEGECRMVISAERASGRPFHRSHFATCPDHREWRKPRGTP